MEYSLRIFIYMYCWSWSWREFFLTKVFSAFVLVDVYVDLFDSLQSLGELGPVRVALWCGSQKLHQQKRVTHHSLNGLD